MGLGAETLDSTVRKKKEERLILFKKIQKRIKKEQNEPEPDELRLMKNGRTGTSPNNDSEDEGCSRTNIINSATSRKRQKLEALKNRRLNRKRNKNKKRALIKTITTCTEDMCMDQGAGGGEIINNDILKKPVFVETNGQDMLSRRPQRGVGLNELLTADKVMITFDVNHSKRGHLPQHVLSPNDNLIVQNWVSLRIERLLLYCNTCSWVE